MGTAGALVLLKLLPSAFISSRMMHVSHLDSSSPALINISASTSNILLGGFHRRSLQVSVSRCVRRSSTSRDDESKFMDQDGVIEDMDGYLNYLSPEYESVWDTKPSWCQPWTITVTGVSIVACSWLLVRSVLVTAVIALLISTWWYIFLYSYPKAYTEMIAERRKRVKTGMEDTFGFTNRQ